MDKGADFDARFEKLASAAFEADAEDFEEHPCNSDELDDIDSEGEKVERAEIEVGCVLCCGQSV
jgi:hypothetical protein